MKSAVPSPEGLRLSEGGTVLVTGARAPVALHLARLFDTAGWRVVLADVPARPLARSSRACAAYGRFPSPRFQPDAFADAIETLVERQEPSLVIPTCEEVFYLAGVWARRRLRPELFAPGPDLLRTVHNKYDFIVLCETFGLSAPRTRLLTNVDDLAAAAAQARDLVFKPVWSRFASRTLVAPSQRQLRRIRPTAAMPWVAQERLSGTEISAYAIARGGRLLGLSLYRSLYRAGAGAGICFEPVTDAAARDFVETFVGKTGWTGQVSFDLMRLEDGTVRPMECNPRATSGIHFFAQAERFVEVLSTGDGEAIPDVTAPQSAHLAMWVYGLPAALRSGRPGRFLGDLKRSGELLGTADDPAPGRAQWRVFAGITMKALLRRISLQEAATRDIEWNGSDQSSM